MSKDKTGGPAFPLPEACDDNGMTLRDWFAGMALQGYIAAGVSSDVSMREVALKVYCMADAMIEKRER